MNRIRQKVMVASIWTSLVRIGSYGLLASHASCFLSVKAPALALELQPDIARKRKKAALRSLSSTDGLRSAAGSKDDL